MINGVDYFSHKTSCNRIPRGIYALAAYWRDTKCNLDYGGGKFDTATDWLKEQGIESHVYDPFNRSAEHNANALKHKFTTVTLLNVLNTIESREERVAVIKDAFNRLEHGGTFIIQIYEGDKTGVGRIGKTNTYQCNRILEEYIPEMQEAIVMPFFYLSNKQYHIIAIDRKSKKLEDFLRKGKEYKTCWK